MSLIQVNLMEGRRHRALLSLCIWMGIAFAGPGELFARDADGLVPVPALSARVTDLTGTLNGTEKDALEKTLAEFERKQGSQIAVLIVPGTAPETIEEYSIRVVETWKLGRKDVDDGLLLLVAKNDRKLRIEVGYGLEGAVTDAEANRIIDEYIVPRFKRGEFYRGLHSGLDLLMRLVEGEDLPPPRARATSGTPEEVPPLAILIFGVIVLSIFTIILAVSAGPLPSTAISSISGFLLGLFTMDLFFGFGIAIFLGLLAWLMSSQPTSASGSGYSSGSFSSAGGSGSAWSGGGYSSGDSSSWDSDFGGGGGDFGGGGASGDW